jgi:hypothetical protein
MNLYFVKATYTNNVYKLSDFYTGDNYIQNAMKMLSMVFKADDGVSSLIVPNKLPDNTDVRNYTHIMIPELNKIYRIVSVDYWNTDQYQLTLDDDPLIANYVELKTKNIIMKRSNDYSASTFNGVNDISKLGVESATTISLVPSTYKTGKWALLFFQYNSAKTKYGLKFKQQQPYQYEQFSTYAALIAKYPNDAPLSDPARYDYYQKICYVVADVKLYQCVYYDNGTAGNLVWIEYTGHTLTEVFFGIDYALITKLNPSDVSTCVIALPFEGDLRCNATEFLIDYNNFVGTSDPDELIDVKIIDDIFFPISSISYTYDSVKKTMVKPFGATNSNVANLYDSSNNVISGFKTITFTTFNSRINISLTDVNNEPLECEPFQEYELYVFGKKFDIPSFFVDKIGLLIGIYSGVSNYSIFKWPSAYYQIAVGSFTHSAKYQVDKLDAFYNQNPTYKDQFYLKMATDSMKTIAGGAIGGSVVPGIGTALGAAGGLGAAVVDAGLASINLMYQEKSLMLQADQIYGDNSDLNLQLLHSFSIYWRKKVPVLLNASKTEYFLRGFPVSNVTSVASMTARANDIFGVCKIVYGEIKEVVKNEYVTGYINAKLQNGVIFI